MKFTDENGGEWENTTSEYGNGTHWIRRIPPREKSNAEKAEQIAKTGGFLVITENILDAMDAKIAPLKELLEKTYSKTFYLEGQIDEMVTKLEKLEGGK